MTADPYWVPPFTTPVNATVRLPGSKSITNRAMLLAALSGGETTLTGALFSEDTAIMAEALRRLGFSVHEDATCAEIRVTGNGGKIPAPSAELFVGLAGTAARFLTALCCLAPHGTYRLDGVPQMRKRPMKSLLDALQALGAQIASDGGRFPLTIHAHGLAGGDVSLDATESSQLLSALLMVAPLARGPVAIRLTDPGYRREYVSMTLRMMEQFGQPAADVSADGLLVRPRAQTPYRMRGDAYAIEPDASAASYFLALPYVVGGRISLPGMAEPSLQGDFQFWRLMDHVGAEVRMTREGVECSFDKAKQSTEVVTDEFDGQDFHAISDTFLTLAAISPVHNGTTYISGIAHTRNQETDRIAGMARELEKLGQHVEEQPDGLRITPNLEEMKRRAARGAIEIETYGDHRFAMSFAILGCHNLFGTDDPKPWLAIKNPGVCAKTFPEFFTVLENARRDSSRS